MNQWSKYKMWNYEAIIKMNIGELFQDTWIDFFFTCFYDSKIISSKSKVGQMGLYPVKKLLHMNAGTSDTKGEHMGGWNKKKSQATHSTND